MAAIPWCSPVTVFNKDDDQAANYRLLTGPAKYKYAGWCLPIYGDIDPEATSDQTCQRVHEMRLRIGFGARQT